MQSNGERWRAMEMESNRDGGQWNRDAELWRAHSSGSSAWRPGRSPNRVSLCACHAILSINTFRMMHCTSTAVAKMYQLVSCVFVAKTIFMKAQLKYFLRNNKTVSRLEYTRALSRAPIFSTKLPRQLQRISVRSVSFSEF